MSFWKKHQNQDQVQVPSSKTKITRALKILDPTTSQQIFFQLQVHGQIQKLILPYNQVIIQYPDALMQYFEQIPLKNNQDIDEQQQIDESIEFFKQSDNNQSCQILNYDKILETQGSTILAQINSKQITVDEIRYKMFQSQIDLFYQHFCPKAQKEKKEILKQEVLKYQYQKEDDEDEYQYEYYGQDQYQYQDKGQYQEEGQYRQYEGQYRQYQYEGQYQDEGQYQAQNEDQYQYQQYPQQDSQLKYQK